MPVFVIIREYSETYNHPFAEPVTLYEVHDVFTDGEKAIDERERLKTEHPKDRVLVYSREPK